MIRPRLDRAVARATGEALATIRRRGFQPPPRTPRADLEPEDLRLAVACPFCGRAAPLDAGPAGLPELGECPRCDVEFDYRPEEVEAVARAEPRAPRRAAEAA